jgi:hypothetical protein
VSAVTEATEATVPVRVTAWRPINKDTLIGSVDIVLGRSLEINGLLVLRSAESNWVAFPGEPRIGADDKVIRDTRGKKQHNTILKWSNRASSDRFKNAVLTAITERFGEGAFDNGDDAS